MKLSVVLLGGLLAIVTSTEGQVQISLPFQNPAGVILRGDSGFHAPYQFQQLTPQQPIPQPAQQQQQVQVRDAQAEQQGQFEQQAQAQADAQAQAQAQAEQNQQQEVAAQQQAEAQQQAQQQQQQQPQLVDQQPQPELVQQPQQVVEQPQPQLLQQQVAQQPQLYQQPQLLQQQVVQQPIQYHRAVQAVPAVQAAPAVQYHQQAVQYAAPAVQYHQQALQYAAPAVAVAHQKHVGYATTPYLTKVPGVADVPITKLAYTQGFTQKEIDVAHPAVTTRKVKVRRPALRKEFYDIEHRVIVRPAGSATLELSQPISKEQKGPTLLTATKFAHHAPVVRYGLSRRIVDGGEQSYTAVRAGQPAGPAPQPRQAQPRAAPPAQTRQAVDADTEVIEAARDDLPQQQPQQQQPQPQQQQQAQPQEQPQGQQQQHQQQFQQQQQQFAQQQQQLQQQQQQQFQQQQQQQQVEQQQAPQPAPAPQGPAANAAEARGITITPDMPAELQNRLLQLLTAKGGTVTEVLNENGSPANSASVLQVADALGDVSLQGGEKITTRRIVVTRPIETIQEIDVQEPATKIQRVAVQTPTLFKTHIPAVARVPVALPAVKHVSTPVFKTHYTAAAGAPAFAHYASPQAHYARYA